MTALFNLFIFMIRGFSMLCVCPLLWGGAHLLF
ncbi:Uncharacterised protein [Rodentibacter pneumotropicus]|uniref:Uncharacterized protein n=1 Tax=Rodentibacter pneumotropicus TaxID=758 RepID=A0A3S4VDV5_9PAST|nr:Uncharacterised protein [Rodentibacter pneumotropicus]